MPMSKTAAATILIYLDLAVHGPVDGDAFASNPEFKVALDNLRARFVSEGESLHDELLATFADAAQGRVPLMAILRTLS